MEACGRQGPRWRAGNAELPSGEGIGLPSGEGIGSLEQGCRLPSGEGAHTQPALPCARAHLVKPYDRLSPTRLAEVLRPAGERRVTHHVVVHPRVRHESVDLSKLARLG
eukprot:7383075-Prymnesium_polylepis.1